MCLLIGAMLACRASTPTSSPAGREPAPTAVAGALPVPKAAARPLPAGLYFRGYDTCGDCEMPTHVVLAEVLATPGAAEAAVAAIPAAATSTPGYPLVVHSDELGVVGGDHGIVIVLGLFGSAQAADAWAVAHAPRSRVLALLDNESDVEGAKVVRIAAGVPVAAYDRRAVERVDASLEERTWSTRAEWTAALRAGVEALEPACMLAPGAIQLWEPDVNFTHWYAWAPVQCGDVEAYVAWANTSLTTTVIPLADGSHEIVQVAGAECDTPILARWPWSPGGKSTGDPSHPLLAQGGC